MDTRARGLQHVYCHGPLTTRTRTRTDTHAHGKRTTASHDLRLEGLGGHNLGAQGTEAPKYRCGYSGTKKSFLDIFTKCFENHYPQDHLRQNPSK